MGKSAWGYDNKIITGVLRAGSEEQFLGINQLKILQGSPSTGWQTKANVVESTIGAWLEINAQDTTTWRAFLLARTNLTASAKVRWRVGSYDSVILPSNPVVEIDFLAADPFVPPATGTFAVARASVAWRCKSDMTWEEVAANTLRIHHHPLTGERLGALSESASTNRIRNPRGEGLVFPSTAPTNYSVVTANGISVEWIGFDTLDGLPGYYIRIFGTAGGGTGQARVYFETTTGIAVTTGLSQNLSLFTRAVADYLGTLAGLSSTTMGWVNLTAGGSSLSEQSGALTLSASRVGHGRQFYRASSNGGGTQANLRPFIEFLVTNGSAVDFAIFVAAPQHEHNQSVLSTPMLPPIGAPAAFTRATETISYTPPGGTINSARGTLVHEWVPSSVGPSFVHPGVQSAGTGLQLDNGTSAERYQIKASTAFAGAPISSGTVSSDLIVIVGNVTVYNANNGEMDELVARAPTDVTPTNPTRQAMAYGEGLPVYGASTGRFLDSAYTSPLPSGLNRLTSGGNQFISPCSVRWRYYDERFSQARLVGVTVNGEALDSSSITYDSGLINAGVQFGIGQSLVVPPSSAIGRYARCDISDPTNPDGFINVGLAYAGPVWEPSFSIDWSSNQQPVLSRVVVEARGGQEHVEPLFVQRVWQISLSALTEEELWQYQQVLDKVAASGQNVLFIPISDSLYTGTEAILGLLKSQSSLGFSTRSRRFRTWRARLTERL